MLDLTVLRLLCMAAPEWHPWLLVHRQNLLFCFVLIGYLSRTVDDVVSFSVSSAAMHGLKAHGERELHTRPAPCCRWASFCRVPAKIHAESPVCFIH